MTPSIKLNSIALAIATMIVFSIWTFITNLDSIPDTLKIILGSIISLGLYRLIASFIIFFTKQSIWIKRQLFGAYYLEGTWVGFYIGVSGKERFIIERFEQNLETLVIRGKSFNEHTKFHSTWTAPTVSIDMAKGKISYMYETIPINDKLNNNGIAIFNLERDSQYKAPKGLTGFSSDLHLGGNRVKAMEVKISNSCSMSETEALKEAKKIYTENKDKFID